MTAFEAVTSRPLQLQIADHLAQRIISGELPDGARLPATLELAKLYHVTPVTIHKSLQHLVQRQLIERVPRRGTFVRSRERVNVIGLAFGKNPFLHQSPLYPQLLDQFQRQTPERDLNLKIYFDFESGNRALFDLEQDLASGEIKAVIACNRSNRLTRFLDEHPEVTWLEPIGLDQRGTVKKGVEYLIRQGFRNILVVSMLPQELEYEDFRGYFRDEQQGAAEAVAGTEAVAEVIRWGQTDFRVLCRIHLNIRRVTKAATFQKLFDQIFKCGIFTHERNSVNSSNCFCSRSSARIYRMLAFLAVICNTSAQSMFDILSK